MLIGNYIGCGNGAFTEMIVERCAPVSVDGIDPSEAQLAYARARTTSRLEQFRQGKGQDPTHVGFRPLYPPHSISKSA
jgi:trans-aconitate methyltransferase